MGPCMHALCRLHCMHVIVHEMPKHAALQNPQHAAPTGQQDTHTNSSPVDGRLYALHEDVGGEAPRLAQPLGSRLAVQVVPPALALWLEHKLLWMPLCAVHDVFGCRVFQVVQAPQACRNERRSCTGILPLRF